MHMGENSHVWGCRVAFAHTPSLQVSMFQKQVIDDQGLWLIDCLMAGVGSVLKIEYAYYNVDNTWTLAIQHLGIIM